MFGEIINKDENVPQLALLDLQCRYKVKATSIARSYGTQVTVQHFLAVEYHGFKLTV